MDADLYIEVLDRFLVPFIQKVYPHGHRFQQDNDPEHTSRCAQAFFHDHGINWWRTPPESPDANPIENLWHELKVNALIICTYMCMYVLMLLVRTLVRQWWSIDLWLKHAWYKYLL